MDSSEIEDSKTDICSLLKSWQFREVLWVPKQPETLADVPGDVKCVCCRRSMWQVVWRDDRGRVHAVNEYGGCGPELSGTPDEYKLVRYLDTPPQKPMSLNDVPDGRVIRCQDRWHWKVGPTWWRLSNSGGVWPNLPPKRESEFTITDYIAEFRGPA